MMFGLNAGDDNDDVKAYVTCISYDIYVSMLPFTRHCKDSIQERLTILISCCSKFIAV